MIQIERIFISLGHNFVGHHGRPPGTHPNLPMKSIECVAGRGIRGDRYFDYKPNYKGQITFFSMERFERMCSELDLANAEPSATRRNVFTRGVNLEKLVGAEFQIQGVRFAGIEECRPCYWMNSALGEGAEEWLRGRGGLRAAILSDGILSTDLAAKHEPYTSHAPAASSASADTIQIAVPSLR